MATCLVKAKHSVWLGKGQVPYPENLAIFRKMYPNWNVKLWTLDNRPRNFPLLEDMINNGHIEIAAEYYKVVLLTTYRGVYIDYHIELLKPITSAIMTALKRGFSVAKHNESYTGVDYLSTSVIYIPQYLIENTIGFQNFIIDYRDNFEHFYREGERNPKFFGDNLYSRCKGAKILTYEEAYMTPHDRVLKVRGSELVKSNKRTVLPSTAFFAEPHEQDNIYVLGRAKPFLGYQ
jgi:hypothetical protein